MSIIYDALKKTEKSINTHNTDPQVEAALKKKRIKNKIKTSFLYLLAIGVGLFAGNLFFVSLSKSKILTKAHPEPKSSVKKIAFVSHQPEALSVKPKEASLVENLPILSSPKKSSHQSFVLNGLFFSQNEGYALINNRVVKVGDSVGGAVVKKIELEEVELEQEGSKIKLSAQ